MRANFRALSTRLAAEMQPAGLASCPSSCDGEAAILEQFRFCNRQATPAANRGYMSELQIVAVRTQFMTEMARALES